MSIRIILKRLKLESAHENINNGKMKITGLRGGTERGKIINDYTGWDFRMWPLAVFTG